MADAGGAFITRAFEKMLKDAGNRKFVKLQQALKSYLDRPKHDVFLNLAIDDDGVEKQEIPANGEDTENASAASAASAAGSLEKDEQSLQQSSANVNAAATMAEAGHKLEGYESDIIINPIRLAIETKQSKLIETALDCLHKLIAYGHLEGEAGVEGGANGSLATELFQLVCNCTDHTAVDSVVLQVIKVILTAVASTTFQVHGECLILGIRTCYNIVLNSKNPVNLMTAKGTLTQMISIVFKRMEASELGLPTNQPVRQYSQIDQPFSPISVDAQRSSDNSEGKPQSVSMEDIQTLAGASNIRGLEAVLEEAARPLGGGDPDQVAIKLETLVISQRDALLVFRTLCKMASKEGNEELIVRTKVLSLELLQGLLESVSHEFTVNFAFIDSIKYYLSSALVRAYVSKVEKVFQLACNIFAVLILRFRESLKAEIAIFFHLVVLRSLDSADVTSVQRTMVLKMLEALTNDPQMLADVFVNYDCDLEATNLFERMVNSVSRIAQGMPPGDPSTLAVAQNKALEASSLQCLVNILASLAEWSKRNEGKLDDGAAGEDLPTVPDGSDVVSKEEAKEASKSIGSQADLFGKAKAHKSIIEAAVNEFNMKPSKGIAYLESHKIIGREPAAIANFLRTTPGLHKTLVGDYLGEYDEFHVAVMHAYVDSMSFENMKFDQAIREFLKGFRLPGEAQKIDRIMEKFAERYCRDNPGVFKTADTAYVLAYAVIMLNTDAHNPVVTAKMTKADFVRINSGMDGEEGAPVPLLEEIYDSIVANEIKLKDDGPASGKGARRQAEERVRVVAVLNLATPRKRSASDTKLESEEIVRRTQALVKSSGAKRGVFHTARHAELARPMLEAVGWPLLAAFSVTMEDSESRPRIALCMEGFRLGIHLTKLLGMETMRYALLTSLVRFTFLHAPKEMRPKNVEALKTLLTMAEQEPDALQDAWNAVLECISRLEHITSTPALSGILMGTTNQASKDALLASLVELAGKPSEQVFINSSQLPSDQVVEFFTALCRVSAEELKLVPARVFSLQKLVEISYYNMVRIRMVWARIWAVLSAHFVAAGGHYDEKIAMYAIDSLRQLAMKYLERSELAQFTFQNDIMKPFVVIMRTSKNLQIRELIIQCIVQMIHTKVASIKSGWKSIFMVLTTAAADVVVSIVETAFENVELVVLEHFEQVMGDCFMDCVNCLIAFANNKVSPRISLKAIALLRICEDRLAEGRVPGGASRPVNDGEKANDLEVAEYYWFPMLAGLSDLTSDPRLEVRNCALEVLFGLLKERGHSFSTPFWETVFERVLFPIFDYVRHAGSDGARPASADLWLLDTSIHCLHLLCDLFCSFYKAVSFLLPNLLGLLLDCATRLDQGLAAIAVGALLRLMDTGGAQFSAGDWEDLLDSIRHASMLTQPSELLDLGSGENGAVVNRSPNLKPKIPIPRGNEADHLFPQSGTQGEEAVIKESKKNNNGGKDQQDQLDTDFTQGGGGESEGAAALEQDTSANGRMEGRADTIMSSNNGNDPQAGRVAEGNEIELSVELKDGKGLFGGSAASKGIMGSMMDSLLLKNLNVKASAQNRPLEVSTLPSTPPVESGEEPVSSTENQDTHEVSDVIRTKSYVQLLLLNALDHLQAKHWSRLGTSHKRQLLDYVQTMVEFAAAYNSHQNLRTRMMHTFADRPPPSLLRQETAGTQLYLTTLLRAIDDPAVDQLPPSFADKIPMAAVPLLKKFQIQRANGSAQPAAAAAQVSNSEDDELALRGEAEERLLNFCRTILASAASLQPSSGEAVEAEIHRSLALRAPVVAKVLLTLSHVDRSTFNRFIPELYPQCTRLICSDQMEIRKALGELFKAQLTALIP